MADLFDLFDDEPAPVPAESPTPVTGTPEPEIVHLQVRADRRTPTALEHFCDFPGCKRWGCLGLNALDIVNSLWWCFEHAPTAARGPGVKSEERLAK